jgi:hypothetical protein
MARSTTISGLHMETPLRIKSFGLFGRMVGATIQNLKIIDVDINDVKGSSGALAGYAENCTINNCYSNGNIMVSTLHQIMPEVWLEICLSIPQ